MAEVESNLPAAAEEKKVLFPSSAEIKAAWERRVAEGISEEEEKEEQEDGDDLYFASQASCFRDDWNELYSRYFGRFEDTSELHCLLSDPIFQILDLGGSDFVSSRFCHSVWYILVRSRNPSEGLMFHLF